MIDRRLVRRSWAVVGVFVLGFSAVSCGTSLSDEEIEASAVELHAGATLYIGQLLRDLIVLADEGGIEATKEVQIERGRILCEEELRPIEEANYYWSTEDWPTDSESTVALVLMLNRYTSYTHSTWGALLFVEFVDAGMIEDREEYYVDALRERGKGGIGEAHDEAIIQSEGHLDGKKFISVANDIYWHAREAWYDCVLTAEIAENPSEVDLADDPAS